MSYTAYLTWIGRTPEEIANNHIGASLGSEEANRESFRTIVSQGLVNKNEGFFLGKISTPVEWEFSEKFNSYEDSEEQEQAVRAELASIINGEHEQYAIGEILESYVTSLDDWLPEAREVVYDNEETSPDITLNDKGDGAE